MPSRDVEVPLLHLIKALPSPPQHHQSGSGVSASALTLRKHPRNHNRITCRGCKARLPPTSDCSSSMTAAPPTIEPAPVSPATQPPSSASQAFGHASGALPLLNLYPPNLLQAGLTLNRNAACAYEFHNEGGLSKKGMDFDSESRMTASTSTSFKRRNSCLKA